MMLHLLRAQITSKDTRICEFYQMLQRQYSSRHRPVTSLVLAESAHVESCVTV